MRVLPPEVEVLCGPPPCPVKPQAVPSALGSCSASSGAAVAKQLPSCPKGRRRRLHAEGNHRNTSFPPNGETGPTASSHGIEAGHSIGWDSRSRSKGELSKSGLAGGLLLYAVPELLAYSRVQIAPNREHHSDPHCLRSPGRLPADCAAGHAPGGPLQSPASASQQSESLELVLPGQQPGRPAGKRRATALRFSIARLSGSPRVVSGCFPIDSDWLLSDSGFVKKTHDERRRT